MDDDDEQDLQLAPRSRQDEDYSIPEYARPTQAEELPPFVQRARQPAPAAEELPPFVQRAQPERQAPADEELPPFVRQAQQQQQAQPEAEGMIGTAAREAKQVGIGAAGAVAVGRAGGMLAGRYLGGALGSFAGPVGTVGGMVAGSYLAERALNALGFDDSHQRAVNAKENPTAAIVGESAGLLPFFGPGSVARAGAGLVERVTPRVVGGVAMGGIEGARQAYEGEFDPLRLAAQTATGAVLAKPTALTRGIESRVGGAMERAGFPAEGAPDTAAAREEVQPAGQPAGPKVSRGTAEEAPPPQEQKVGDVQNNAVGSARDYAAAPRAPEGEAFEGRLMTPGEISTARSGINVGADPGISAALGGEYVIPAEDRAMLLGQRQQGPGPGDIEPRARTAERPADVLRGPAAERPAAPPIPPGLEELAARHPGVQRMLEQRYPEMEAMQRQQQFQQQEQPQPGLSPAARAFQARMAAQRAAQQGGTLSPTGGVPGGGGPGGPGGPAAPAPPPPPAAGPPPTAAQQLASPVQAAWKGLQNVFAPQMRGPMARRLADWVRGAYGASEQLRAQTSNILDQHVGTIRNMSEDERRTLVARAQGNTAYNPTWVPNQAQRALLGDIKGTADMWANKLSTLDRAKQIDWIENYLPGMYKNPQQNPDFFRGRAGAGGSLKQKVFPDYEAARAAGLEPITNDPIRMMKLYGESMRNFIGKQEVMERGLRSGLFIEPKVFPQRVGAAGSPEPQIRNPLPPNYVESRASPGVFMPEEVVHAWDNFHSAGLRGGQAKDVYGAIRTANSAWTNLELSLNGYHAFTMANEAIITDVAMALEKMAGGRIAGGLRTLAQAPAAFRTQARLGTKVQQSYLDPKSTDPVTRTLVQAGFRPIGRSHARDVDLGQRTFLSSLRNLPEQLRQGMRETRQDWLDSQGNVLAQIGYPFRLAQRAIATVSHPLFEVYIPKLKAGAAYKQMEHWRELNPNQIGTEAETAAARKIVDSIDNRFGEMITDHMFMNKVVQDMGVAGMRSFSWFMGSLKEIGGGAYSGARAVTRAAIERDPSRLGVLNPANPNYDPRVAYTIAMPMTIAATSAIYQYLVGSRDAPKDWRDLYAPRTGGMVKGVGKGAPKVPEHMLMPGYHKDVHGWLDHPLIEAYNKLGGLWSTAIEELRGRGSPAIGSPPFIRPNASFSENIADRMAYFFSKLGPIGARAYIKGSKEGSKIPDWMLAAGFHAPGAEIQAPKQLHAVREKQDRAEFKTMARRANADARTRGRAPPYPGYARGGVVPPAFNRGGPVLREMGQRAHKQTPIVPPALLRGGLALQRLANRYAEGGKVHPGYRPDFVPPTPEDYRADEAGEGEGGEWDRYGGGRHQILGPARKVRPESEQPILPDQSRDQAFDDRDLLGGSFGRGLGTISPLHYRGAARTGPDPFAGMPEGLAVDRSPVPAALNRGGPVLRAVAARRFQQQQPAAAGQ